MTPRQAAEHAQSRNGVSQGQRPVLSRFAAARTAVACRELVEGSSCRQLSQAVVDISRVPRLTAIRLSEVIILQKIVRGYSHKRVSKNLTISPLYHNEIFQNSFVYQMFPTKSSSVPLARLKSLTISLLHHIALEACQRHAATF